METSAEELFVHRSSPRAFKLPISVTIKSLSFKGYLLASDKVTSNWNCKLNSLLP